jgi:hypothetical protein
MYVLNYLSENNYCLPTFQEDIMAKKSGPILFGPLFICSALALLVACSASQYPEQNLKISRSTPIPPQFVKVEKYDAQSITISIHVKFIQSHLYHILSDEEDNFIAQGWFPTSKDASGRYSVTMTAKEGYSFAPGQEILLCIGQEHPEKYMYRSNAYQCLANIWLTLE